MLPLHHDPATPVADQGGRIKAGGGSENYCLVYPFQSMAAEHIFLLTRFRLVVALRIELSATRLSAEYGQPALDDRLSRTRRSRTETLLLPEQACYHLCTSARVRQNGRI